MTWNKYVEPEPTDRTSAERALRSADPEVITDTLVRIALHDPDWHWVQSWCLALAGSDDVDVRGLALTCLGHLARLHGRLDEGPARALLERFVGDPDVGGRAQSALEDLDMYLGRGADA